MAIKLMIDSASDISKEEANKLGILMIPMIITIDNEDYYDGVDISPYQFYEKLVKSNNLPKTSQINPYRFEEEFKKFTSNGDELIVITISSKLSGTYESAKQAALNFEEKVHVVDSLNACIGERLLCMYALRLIGQNIPAKKIVDELNRIKSKINVLAIVDTLEYLRKGGRVSSAVAFAGELLSIKPLVSVVEGEVKLIGKARGVKKANSLLNTFVEKKGGIDFTMPYGVIYSGLDDSSLKKYLKESIHLFQGEITDIPSHILGGTIGTHVGPGAIGIAFFEK